MFFVLWSWCCWMSWCVILFLLLFDNCFTSKRCRGVLYTDSARWISLPWKRNCLQMIHTKRKRAVVCPVGSPHTLAKKSLNWVWLLNRGCFVNRPLWENFYGKSMYTVSIWNASVMFCTNQLSKTNNNNSLHLSICNAETKEQRTFFVPKKAKKVFYTKLQLSVQVS